MTMQKRENSIWSRVRSDVDVDDLIFGCEDSGMEDSGPTYSDR